MIVPAKNWVYIKLDTTNQDQHGNIIRDSGLILPTASNTIGAFRQGKDGAQGEDTRIAAKTTGTVLAFSGLDYREHDNVGESDLDFDTEEELQGGDYVIFDHKEYYEAVRNGRCPHPSLEEGTIIVNYSKIFIRIRNEEITPINGYLLVEPLMEEKKSKLETIDKLSETKGIVRYAGTPVRYRMPIYYDPDSEWSTVMPASLKEPLQTRMAQAGDTVMFKDYNAKDLQHFVHQKLAKRYYVMQRRDILLIW